MNSRLTFLSLVWIHIIFCNSLNGENDEVAPEYIFEDDMIVYDVEDSDGDYLPDVIASALRLWEMKDMKVLIPYTIPNGLSKHQADHINMALEEFKTKTCIEFKERSNETDFVHIYPINYPISCRSAVGKKGGKQIVRCGNCKVNGTFHYGVLLHELMHAVGFVHEQTRSDRDNFIHVDFDEIAQFEKDDGWPNGTWAKQFIKCNYTRIGRKYGCRVLNTYDKDSITHYPAVIGESNPRTIITSKVPCGVGGCNFGQRVGLSDGDIADIEKLYQCSLKYQQFKGLCNAKLEEKDNAWSSEYEQAVRESDKEAIQNLNTKVDMLTNFNKQQNVILDHMMNQTALLMKMAKKMDESSDNLNDPILPNPIYTESITLDSSRVTTSPSPILNLCTVGGNPGDGRTRGSCDEGRICQSDGSCLETCKNNGLPGDSSTRGSCYEGYLCRADGGCAKGCRVNGNAIGDGRSQGNCKVDHLCQSSGICKHKTISVSSSCKDTYDTTQKLLWSPNYPSNYDINQICVWKIKAPPGRQLKLEFNSFETELRIDNLTIYDGANTDAVRIEIMHGASLPHDIFSTSNSITLEFKSDGSRNYRGFELNYSLKVYNNFKVIKNKRCKGNFKIFSALDIALSKCSSFDCAIVDEGCDDLGRY